MSAEAVSQPQVRAEAAMKRMLAGEALQDSDLGSSEAEVKAGLLALLPLLGPGVTLRVSCEGDGRRYELGEAAS